MEPGHNRNRKLRSPKDPNFKYLYETKPACKGRHIQSLAVPI
jgi:hypothetical protein